MSNNLNFPTPTHNQAAGAVVDFFSLIPGTSAVVVVNSCARNKAVRESDLDIAVLVEAPLSDPVNGKLEKVWQQYYASLPVFRELEGLSRYTCVHLDLFDGRWIAEQWDDGGGPDSFEIEIGNRVAHGVALWQRSNEFERLQAQWLPYYPEPLREARLAMVVKACQHNIERMKFYAGRAEYFQAFDRLYHAFQEFLQALFIAHRVYPIAYNKWLREQVEEWLGLPALFAELPAVLEFEHLESNEWPAKGELLMRLVNNWVLNAGNPGR